jgi:hypothetical protein
MDDMLGERLYGCKSSIAHVALTIITNQEIDNKYNYAA